MITLTFPDVLAAARQLPAWAQTELATVLLKEQPHALPRAEPPKPALEMLNGLSQAELQALADSILAPGRQRRLSVLLRKNRQSKLSEKAQAELDLLLEESDRIALLKSRAAYTLQQLRVLRVFAA